MQQNCGNMRQNNLFWPYFYKYIQVKDFGVVLQKKGAYDLHIPH